MKSFIGYITEAAEKGDCYEAAFHWLLDLDPKVARKATLCHGMVHGQGLLHGKKFGHAWGEIGKVVYDYSNGRELEYPKMVYYALGKINESELFCYPGHKGLGKAARAKHYGPWDMTGDTVDVSHEYSSSSVSEEIPKKINKIGKRKSRIPRDVLSILKMKE
jgi:hypothetical protein